MTQIISLSITDDVSSLLSHVSSRKRSKFICQKILSDVLPTNMALIQALKTKQITEKDILEFHTRVGKLLEARKND